MSENENEEVKVTRRGFVRVAGVAVAAVGLGGLGTDWALERKPQTALAKSAIPASAGYLLVDVGKCAGCASCMLACSLVHHGRESLSLSRIQITQDPFAGFPNDVTQQQCRQCVYPACMEACPTGALHVDAANGNVRTIDAEKCIGCERCIEACPYTPARTLWNFEDRVAEKCDLCADAPYWTEQGGPDGTQACVEVCPMEAIAFTTVVPSQRGDGGYHVNLRTANWKKLGLPVGGEL